MDEESTWFLKGIAFAFLVRLEEVEKLQNENSLKNSKIIDFIVTKKDARRFVDIISGL